MVFQLQAIECPRNGGEIQCLSYLLCDIHRHTLKLQCIYDLKVIVLANEECVIMLQSTFLSNQHYSLP